MKIGIVIHTQTGHTYKFARAIADKFIQNGHEAEIRGLRTVGRVKSRSNSFTIKNIPEIDEYDVVLVGGPVWGFTASPVIKLYLNEEVRDLKGKKVLSFVTMFFPFPNWGGTQAIASMNSELESSKGTILPGEILQYFFGFRKDKLAAAVERIFKAVVSDQ